MSLREVAKGRVRKDEKGRSRRWFQGDDADLFIWVDGDGDIIRCQLTYGNLRGRGTWTVDWDVRHGVRTGEVNSGRMMVDMEDIINFFTQPSPELIGKAISIVDGSEIDPEVKKHFLGQMAKYVESETK